MNIYDLTVPQLTKMLKNLDAWLGLAVAYAERKKFDVNTLAKARLAPDQFSLDRQVQTACDNAKFIVARLAGKEWPIHPDVETTVEQLRARIATVSAYIETFRPEDFAGADERRISLPWMEGKWMRGDEYVAQFALANFYFHITTAYAILRHNGVELGKSHYIGGVPMRS
ncbi:MAG: DUF1993 domain-containing protein [Deltaproteobacteria bacterium]|nr:DUF1993 domain-containing protein [Deltaproteobacteria bacterium]MCW5801481.1 DUF1993 domain-containing protein [Deltaproteobacteria bacterium]